VWQQDKPFGVVCREKGGVIVPRELCVVTTILISCDRFVDVVFQEHFIIILL